MHRRRGRRTRHVRISLRITSRVAHGRNTLNFTVLQLILRDGLLLNLQRRLDESGEEAGLEMPVDVAMEGPYTFELLY